MKKYINPPESEWLQLQQRTTKSRIELQKVVSEIFKDVKNHGDEAVASYTQKFDKITITDLNVNADEIAKSFKTVSLQLQDAIKIAAENIKKFHAAQKEEIQIIETTEGVKCWRESRPISKVGLYIPGGSAPLFSTVLMLGIPAVLAGCEQIILCTPPDKNGNIHPAILFAADIIGIKAIYKIGGIQAIAAMTFGTQTVPKVDKIFGPGNQYVTAAKQEAHNYVAIDMPAGPSEMLIIADDTAVPEFIAADLLAQAEHGEDSQVILLSTSKQIIDSTLACINAQIQLLPRKEIILSALQNSHAIQFLTLDQCIRFSNEYAPEHLILCVENEDILPSITSAGSVFIGNFSCESAGDYASGTNHTLPTNGLARSYSGVSLDSFIKKITFQQIEQKGIINLGPSIELMAEEEQLQGHKNAISVRLKSLLC